MHLKTCLIKVKIWNLSFRRKQTTLNYSFLNSKFRLKTQNFSFKLKIFISNLKFQGKP